MDRGDWQTAVHGLAKGRTRLSNFYFHFLSFPGGSDGKDPPTMRETWAQSLGWEDPLQMGKATHSSILAWTVLSMGSQRARHD